MERSVRFLHEILGLFLARKPTSHPTIKSSPFKFSRNMFGSLFQQKHIQPAKSKLRGYEYPENPNGALVLIEIWAGFWTVDLQT